MTQEEILDYNKKCVELLGWRKTHPNIKNWHIYITPIGSISYDKMLFHSDWNWIMEVVEAIEKLKFRFEIWKLEDANLHRVDILKMGWDSTSVFDAKDGWSKLTYPSKKEAVVQAINQFLIWYNNEYKN